MTAAVSYRSVPTLLDVTALLSNLARFAVMRSTRPQPTLDEERDVALCERRGAL